MTEYRTTYQCAICDDGPELSNEASIYLHIGQIHGWHDLLMWMQKHHLGITQIHRPVEE